MEKHVVIEGIDVNMTDEPKCIPGSTRAKRITEDGIYTDGSCKVTVFSKSQDFVKALTKLCRTISWMRWTTDGKVEKLRDIKKRVKKTVWKENF